MQVFDPDWVEDLAARYETCPDYARPLLCSVATRKKNADARTQIEQWVSALSPEEQDQLVTRLRDPKQFHATYNELLVADLLKTCGHSPIYEHCFDGLSPDWSVFASNGEPLFVVEVVTIEAPESIQHEDRARAELWWRLESIEHYYHLALSAPGMSLAGQDMKQIVQHVRTWLDGIEPDSDADQQYTYRHDAFHITFKLISRKTSHRAPVLSYGPPLAFWVDNDRLRNRLRKKVSKYGVAKELHIPLIVAVVSTFHSGLDTDNLLDVLFGHERYLIVLQGNVPVGVQPGRDTDGLVTQKYSGDDPVIYNTRLSAVLWVDTSSSPVAYLVHNPNAVHPLSPETMSALPNLTIDRG